MPATRCSTLGSDDFIRVPLPAARMTTWISDIRGGWAKTSRQPDYRLSGRARPKWASAVDGLRCRSLKGRSKRVVGPEGIQVRIVTCQRPILGIDSDSALQMCDGRGMFAPLSMGDREHIEGVVVIGVLVSNQVEVGDRLVVFPAVDGDGGGVEALVDRLRRRVRSNRLPLANVEVEPHSFVELLFLGVLSQNAFKKTKSVRIVVALECI